MLKVASKMQKYVYCLRFKIGKGNRIHSNFLIHRFSAFKIVGVSPAADSKQSTMNTNHKTDLWWVLLFFL